jgi:hypothetical protein
MAWLLAEEDFALHPWCWPPGPGTLNVTASWRALALSANFGQSKVPGLAELYLVADLGPPGFSSCGVGGVHAPLREVVITAVLLPPAPPGGRQRGGIPALAIRVRDFRLLTASALVSWPHAVATEPEVRALHV